MFALRGRKLFIKKYIILKPIKAYRILNNDKVPLIAMHKGDKLQADDGALSLGPGPFVELLERACNTEAIVMGKPSELFFKV